MSRPAQIQLLSRFAGVYDPVVELMGFGPLWRTIGEVAAPTLGERVLDVCTGTGGAAWELACRGARVVGLDLAPGMLRCAQRKHRDAGHRYPVDFVHMDARHLAFADRSFPVVTCSMALHEMAEAERERVLAEIARVAGDRAVVAEYRVPRERGRRALFRATRVFEYVESDDFERFVRGDMRERLDRAGFLVGTPRDVSAYRVWPCRVRGGA